MKKFLFIPIITAVSTLKLIAQIPKFSSPVEGC
jgi:hypothetical protein